MNATTKRVFAAGGIALMLVAGGFWWRQATPDSANDLAVSTQRGAPATEMPAVPPSAPQTILNPVPATDSTAPLPVLDDSDAALAEALAMQLGESSWRTWFVPERFVRRVVATVDNLPRQHAPVKTWPLKPVGSWYRTVPESDGVVAAPDNRARYAAYAALLERLDMRQVAAIYLRFYPLFQQAYVDLGYPKGYFNDRLVVAIDDLLATPVPPSPPRLVQTKVLYEFADPALEQRSAGQKIMLRIGPAHADLARARLRELRAAVARAPLPK